MEKALICAALILALSASPAFAESGTQVPEASSALLLALGLLGIIVGRRGGMRPKDRTLDEDRK